MKISLKWLKEYVDFDAPVDDIVHRLTMSGLEVEYVERYLDDFVIDINVTPNRHDCLSHIGIAREVAVLYDKQLRFPPLDFVAETSELDFNVDILNIQLCHRYAGRIVRNVKVSPSPKWMQDRLMSCGIRAINNVVDITNYVLLEFGHPLHAFDLKKIQGNKIIVATAGEIKKDSNPLKINLLDGSERTLDDSMLLINDATSPIALAGVMGGGTSEVSAETKDVFIESAWFLPESIRRTSKLLGIKTESSFRFERGADIKILKKALDRAAYLMRELCGGTIHGKLDIYPRRYFPPKIELTFEKINRFTGLQIPKKEVIRILSALAFEVESDEETISIKPPTSRRDVTRDVDIIEEVLRIYGYDKAPSVIPVAPIKNQSYDSNIKHNLYKNIKKCRDILLNEGFHEAINYSFIGPSDIDLLQLSKDDMRRDTISILNPLSNEESIMRTTLIPSLIKNLVYNVSRGNKNIRLFEIAKVFLKKIDSPLPNENRHLALLLFQEKERILYKDDTEDFFVLKGVIEKLLTHLGLCDVTFKRSKEPFLHQGKSADLFIKGSLDNTTIKLGYFGVLTPQVIQNLPVKIIKQEVLVAEIFCDELINSIREDRVIFSPIIQLPYVERDSAIIVDETLEVANISELLNSCKGKISDIIEEIAIFDIYKGKGIEEGKKSIAFNVRYRSSERTLSDEEVDKTHNLLLSHILPKINGKLRT